MIIIVIVIIINEQSSTVVKNKTKWRVEKRERGEWEKHRNAPIVVYYIIFFSLL